LGISRIPPAKTLPPPTRKEFILWLFGSVTTEPIEQKFFLKYYNIKGMVSFKHSGGKKGQPARRGVALLLGLCLWAAAPAAAQNTDSTFTLEAALSYAAKNNRDLKSSSFDEQLAREQVKEVRSQGLPQVNINGRLQDNLIIPTNLLPAEAFGGEPGTFIPVRFGTKYNATAGVEATQLLFSQSYLSRASRPPRLRGVCPTEHAQGAGRRGLQRKRHLLQRPDQRPAARNPARQPRTAEPTGGHFAGAVPERRAQKERRRPHPGQHHQLADAD
jgi:hypothetical protein